MSRTCAASKGSWLTIAGTGIAIHASGGAGCWLSPVPTGRKADVRWRAGAGRVRPREAVPAEAGDRRMPRTEATCHRGVPVGGGPWASLRRVATRDKRTDVWGS